MKLAEALILRSDLQKRIEQLKVRLNRNVKVQEGDAPAENPVELFKELDQLLAELEIIIQKINKTNSATPFTADMKLSDALTKRDILGMRREILSEAVNAASIKQDRYSKSEVKFFSTINIAQVQKEVDKISKEFRELDTRIQEMNWRTDLIE